MVGCGGTVGGCASNMAAMEGVEGFPGLFVARNWPDVLVCACACRTSGVMS